uniref:Uncharacterized protein n=1 Tax=Anguilla anguilla TaxID=7936 RepID=A0A0E9VD06_ANGAN
MSLLLGLKLPCIQSSIIFLLGLSHGKGTTAVPEDSSHSLLTAYRSVHIYKHLLLS